MLTGKSDSPMWNRGNLSRSKTTTFRPARASKVAAVLPAGPPPMMATSKRSLIIGLRVLFCVAYKRKSASLADTCNHVLKIHPAVLGEIHDAQIAEFSDVR